MDNSNGELKHQVYRKLQYYFQTNTPVHFKLVAGGWCNGKIKSVDAEHISFVLDEFQNGETPLLCEEVILNSIAPYKTKEEIKRDGRPTRPKTD